MKRVLSALLLLVLSIPLTHAQKTTKWDVANPAGWSFKEVPLTMDEGTWMNVDVSPDGKEIVFDLLGDIRRPQYRWTPDNTAIVIWSKGKIKRVDLGTLNVRDIPFQVTNTLKIADALHFKNTAFSEEFTPLAIRQAVTSPYAK